MTAPKKKRKFWDRLKLKYRITIYNYSTLEEVWVQNISRMSFFSLVGFLATLIAAIVAILIIFTPIREFIPGYADPVMRRTLLMNTLKTDSIEQLLRQQEQYMENLKIIMNGGVPLERDTAKKGKVDHSKLNFKKTTEDSLFVSQIEQEERYTISMSDVRKSGTDINKLKFFPPLKGMVSNHFSPSQDHYGTDIVSAENQVICATLNGTVVMAEWTLETGYVIQIQHDNNLLSVYKHNYRLLKEVGEHVRAGEAIAILGNSGEQTTGPHLHFELWYNGLPLNPENYIVF
ncbi:MAG: M23 family metallopeptidase [Bacteroidia bacterium]|nr:M23 family metallopeptidase [Bacteroidia bacterium]